MRYKGTKGKAWELVKKYCRLKEKGCYTCPARSLVSHNAQAGHFLPVGWVGSNNKLSWDHRQIHLQCGHCNGPKQGHQVEYEKRMRREYGDDVVDDMWKRAKSGKPDPVKNWQLIIDEYTQLIAEL